MSNRIIRLPELRRITGLSTSTLQRLEITGVLPKSRRVAKKAVGWLESEILDWVKKLALINRQKKKQGRSQ